MIVRATSRDVERRGTAPSATCMVTKTTRRRLPASIMRTSRAPVSSFKSSVWPLIGKPARVTQALLIGAVTMPRDRASPARAGPRSRCSDTRRGRPRSTASPDGAPPRRAGSRRRPAIVGRPPRVARRQRARRARRPRRAARRRSGAADASPSRASSRRRRSRPPARAAGAGATSAFRITSAPTPAGSPKVMPSGQAQRKISTWCRARRSWFSQRSYRVSIASL